MLELLIGLLGAGTPYLLATLGEVYAERSGVMNLGLEGIISLGAFTGFAVFYQTGSIPLAMLLSGVVGLLLSLVHAVVSISFRANQIVSGIALSMLGLGLSGFFGRGYVGLKAPPAPFHGLDPIMIFALALSFVLWFVMFRTRIGLMVRATGENPSAADAQGIDVYKVRYACVAFGGFLGGMAGAYLSTIYTPMWIEGLSAGRGWICIALVILASWNPLRAIIASYIFGGIEILQFRLQVLNLGVRPEFYLMLPYLSAMAVLLIFSRETMRKKWAFPAALAQPYSREEA